MANGGERGPRVIVGRGPRAVERQLIATLRPLLDAAHRDPALLSRPVLLIVASGTLRRHLARVLARELGPTLLGLRIQTLWAVAREILERAGERAPADGGFFEILVRREAAKHDALVERLGALEDGYAAVAASVRDLDSAGLDAAALDAALEAIPGGARRTPEARRTAAVLRSATGTAAAMRGLGLGRPADALRRAAALLAEQGPDALPARALFVHGFADATGAATTLLRALLALPAATLLLDEPPDPARDDGAPDPGNAFRERFETRLGLTGLPRERAEAAGATTLELFHAAGRDAEAREIAHRIREWLHAPASAPPTAPPPAPEQIGVVVRSLDGWELPFRRWFERLGVPFSGGDEPGGLRPAARRLQALLVVIERAGSAPVDAWLDAAEGSVAGAASRHDLRLALRALGVARLEDAARVDLAAVLDGHGNYRLPVRMAVAAEPRDAPDEGDGNGDWNDGAGDGAEPPDAEFDALETCARRVPGAALRDALAAARGTAERVAAWPSPAPLARFLDAARALGAGLLADDPAAGTAWAGALDALGAEAAPGEPLSREEFLLLARPRVEAATRHALGGAGGGVRLLDVARARGLTFTRLFLAGVNRDRFPRRQDEDPLLSDATRRRLAAALPNLPEKSWGGEEERFLFAQLTDAAPVVTISWQRADDDGKVLDPSPFVQRLRLERPALEPVAVARPRGEALDRTVRLGRALTAAEHLQRAALAGDLELVERLAPLAWSDAARRLPAAARALDGLDRAALARARRQALEEWDAPPQGRGAGPLFGFLAPRAGGSHFAADDLWVTAVERLARCPWKAFLERTLGLAPPPDPRAALPEPDPPSVGAVVHDALQRLVADQAGRRPDALVELAAAEPVALRRPPAASVESAARDAARKVALEAGITLPGLHEALARRALPFVQRAIELDWADDGPRLLGTEVDGVATIAAGEGRTVALRFRADRVDRRAADGALVLTDYKTGKLPFTAVKSDTRRQKMAQSVARGELLQGAAYAAADGPGPKIGRYVSLKDLDEPRLVEAAVASDDEAVTAGLPRAVATLLGAARAGSFFPRLEDLEEHPNPACAFCEVRTACLVDDSGMRLRWRAAVRGALERSGPGGTPGGPSDPRLAALLAVMRLGTGDAP
ncbi:MAG: PD-(D/E)XK nuclease family protein [Acidobacteria bacterium]|nr:PD-(D/E)XK nuclease family protein [Acidobacteriota bacterium]